ncbi:tastin-like [Pyrgilauda ruficollis]|uniref:tastin-like n=1 Tax=Pyrgilauda ruficollis TaxID=221976 RepID=UPI001B870C6E|nr:tastin-like [Pyrgilauda ruficollis]
MIPLSLGLSYCTQPGQCCDILSGAEHLGWDGNNSNCLLPASTGLGWLKAREPVELPKPSLSIQPREPVELPKPSLSIQPREPVELPKAPLSIQPPEALTEQPLPPAQPQPGMPALGSCSSWEQLEEEQDSPPGHPANGRAPPAGS